MTLSPKYPLILLLGVLLATAPTPAFAQANRAAALGAAAAVVADSVLGGRNPQVVICAQGAAPDHAASRAEEDDANAVIHALRSRVPKLTACEPYGGAVHEVVRVLEASQVVLYLTRVDIGDTTATVRFAVSMRYDQPHNSVSTGTYEIRLSPITGGWRIATFDVVSISDGALPRRRLSPKAPTPDSMQIPRAVPVP